MLKKKFPQLSLQLQHSTVKYVKLENNFSQLSQQFRNFSHKKSLTGEVGRWRKGRHFAQMS